MAMKEVMEDVEERFRVLGELPKVFKFAENQIREGITNNNGRA